jgi:hypothetical protein
MLDGGPVLRGLAAGPYSGARIGAGTRETHWRAIGVRFVVIVILLALAATVGLFIYGQMLEPEQVEIEVEAVNAAQ